jgi:hypothetical protein
VRDDHRHVPQLDATVAVWREQDGRTARVDDRDGRRQTIISHRTALDAIAAITPQPGSVRDMAARAIADDQANW